jgi:hypothetical protein
MKANLVTLNNKSNNPVTLMVLQENQAIGYISLSTRWEKFALQIVEKWNAQGPNIKISLNPYGKQIGFCIYNQEEDMVGFLNFLDSVDIQDVPEILANSTYALRKEVNLDTI